MKFDPAQLVLLILGVPTAITAVAGFVGQWAQRRGEAHKERAAIEQRKEDEERKDHDELRKDLEAAWESNRKLREELGECARGRVNDAAEHRKAIIKDQDVRHELRSICRTALLRCDEHAIPCKDLRAKLSELYPPTTISE